jgi:hypothetical protein
MLLSFAETVRKVNLPFIAKEVKNEPHANPKKSTLTGEEMTANGHSRTLQVHSVISMNDTKSFSSPRLVQLSPSHANI